MAFERAFCNTRPSSKAGDTGGDIEAYEAGCVPQTRARSAGGTRRVNLLNLSLLLQRGLQGLVVFHELGVAFVLHE